MAEEQVDKLLTDSILETTKKLLGLPKDYTAFDNDITVHINTVLSNLHSIGIGPVNGFFIEGYEQKWSDYEISNPNTKQQIKTYIYQKVRLMFDPPTNGNVLKALEQNISELEYRLYVSEGGY